MKAGKFHRAAYAFLHALPLCLLCRSLVPGPLDRALLSLLISVQRSPLSRPGSAS